LQILLLLASFLSDAGISQLHLTFCRIRWKRQDPDSARIAPSGTGEHGSSFFFFGFSQCLRLHNACHHLSNMSASITADCCQPARGEICEQSFLSWMSSAERKGMKLTACFKELPRAFELRNFFFPFVSVQAAGPTSAFLFKKARRQTPAPFDPSPAPFVPCSSSLPSQSQQAFYSGAAERLRSA
jgi:hypothetical protein